MHNRLITISLILLTIGVLSASAQKVALIGDSNTWIGGLNNEKQAGWNYWFCNLYKPTECRNYARSGATWTNTPQTILNTQENIGTLGDNNVAYNQLQRLFADSLYTPDIVIIALGTNDLWFSRRRPEVFSPSANVFNEDFLALPPNQMLTLEDCTHYAVLSLRAHYPEARIVFVTPPESTKVDLSQLLRFSNHLENLAKKLKVQIIRLDRLSPVKRQKERLKPNYTTDGTHTSPKGAAAHATIITQSLKS